MVNDALTVISHYGDRMLEKNEELAELVGIILGDGSFYIDVDRYIYQLDIAFDIRDKEYFTFVENLLVSTFSYKPYRKFERKSNGVHLRICKKELVLALLDISLGKAGNKIKNRVTIPTWIKTNNCFLKACVRGLVDTDGCIYYLKPHWPNLRQLKFESHNLVLLNDVKLAFEKLGFKTSKCFQHRIVITRQAEIEKYLKEIGPHNPKLIAPSSSGQETSKCLVR